MIASLEDLCATVLSALETRGGILKKINSKWQVSPAEPGLRDVPDQAVARLMSRGKLVPHAQGGYRALAFVRQNSGRVGDYRPPRPPEGEASDQPALNLAESPLSWLRSRKDKGGKPLITDDQFIAGERLRADFEKSNLERRTTANWDMAQTAGAPGGNRVAELTDSMLAARQRYQAALAAVGPELSGMLVQICCLSAGLEQSERLLDLPQRSGKAVLGLALTRLARHYGILKSPQSTSRQPGISAWAMEGYRPRIGTYEVS